MLRVVVAEPRDSLPAIDGRDVQAAAIEHDVRPVAKAAVPPTAVADERVRAIHRRVDEPDVRGPDPSIEPRAAVAANPQDLVRRRREDETLVAIEPPPRTELAARAIHHRDGIVVLARE